MATIEQVKERYQNKSEKNGTNDGITTDNYRFCLLYNEAENKFLTLQLQNRGIDDVRYIQKFLILNYKIPYISPTTDNTLFDFKLPDNYFDLADVTAKAKKAECQTKLYLFELQTENLNEILQDEFSKPSFEWQESFYTVNADKLSVYATDFTVEEIQLNYYRYPSQLKLIDENNPESGFDSTSIIEWDDKSLDDIISMMVMGLDINENNPRFQVQAARIQK